MDKVLEFTGERFTPECVREIWYEHYHRYVFAKHLVKDKTVLDAACGEGYGSNILANSAKNVTGIDIDETSINHAKERYKRENLTFLRESCTELPFKNNSFDVIVSFETLEHLTEQEEMLKEFNRVLKDDGLLIISTPDKKYYSDETGFTNEFHVRELYKNEFENLISKHWENTSWYAQSLSFQSILEKLNSDSRKYQTDILNNNIIESNTNLIRPVYYVVLASKREIKISHPDLHLFADAEQSVYEHYNQTIKDYIYLANKHNELVCKHEKWLSMPILGKIIRLLDKRK